MHLNLIVLFILFIIAMTLVLKNISREKNESNSTCPHGNHYDDCPDCRH